MSQQKWQEEIRAERVRKDEKWGEQDHDPCYWITILIEEVGEAARAVLEGYCSGSELGRLTSELVQVAGVAIAFLESLDRREIKRRDRT